MKAEQYLSDRARKIDRALDKLLPSKKSYPPVLHEAIRYSVFSGGKRIRPVILLACAEACGADYKKALLPACAIELIHTYSLIHDDLPCLDNDDYRRGKPTCHKKFGDAYALLAGDALLTLAFQWLGAVPDAKSSQRLVLEVSKAAGTLGMIGGQAVDKISKTEELDLPALDYMNVNKTGQLIRVSCLAGGIAAGAAKRQELALNRFGEHLGFAFQVIDDIIDRDGYLKFMTESEARRKAAALTAQAKMALKPFGNKGVTLNLIADYILARKR